MENGKTRDGSETSGNPKLDGLVGLVNETISVTKTDLRYIKRLKDLGASNSEIASALGISEDAPALHE